MNRAREETVLLPLSGLLLALLMIASLLGVQGTVDRALNFRLSPGIGLSAIVNPPLVGPAVIARQPVERAANVAAETNSPEALGEPRTGTSANIPPIPVEALAASLEFAESTTTSLARPVPSKILTTKGIVTASLGESKKVKGSQRTSTKLMSAKADRIQLFENTTGARHHGKPFKPTKTHVKGGR